MRIVTQGARDEPGTGFRVLVDRLWPRGVPKQELPHDLWAKEIAPSSGLRGWYHADREARRDEFVRRYRSELSDADHDELLDEIRSGSGRHNGLLVLLSDAREVEASHVPVLQAWLQKQL